MGSNRSKLKKYNVVDLFCGAGGFSLGLKDTIRFNSILANDIDMDMCEAYSLNFPKTKILLMLGLDDPLVRLIHYREKDTLMTQEPICS